MNITPMSRRIGRVSALILMSSALSLGLGGCTGAVEPDPPVEKSNFVGETLSAIRPSLGEGNFLIYDLSIPVLGIDPLYNDGQLQDLWVIVAQCESPQALAVAVLPSDRVTDDIRSEAKAGKFDSMLTECS